MNREPGPHSTNIVTDVRWLSLAAYLAIALAAGTIFMSTGAHFVGPKAFSGVWEDSLMLVRYAHNLATYHAVVWNAGGQPSYGLTSPYYFLLVVVPVAKFVTSQAVAIPVFSSLICGFLFFLTMGVVLFRLLPGPALYRHLAIAAIAVAIARTTDDFSQHLVSGMDTCFAMLFLTIYIALARWHSLSGTMVSATVTGVIGGLSFGARPDLLAWTVGVPVIWMILVRDKRLSFIMLGSTILVLGLQLGFAASYFHSALPLPFYAKSTQLYPGLTGFRYVAFHNFFLFLVGYWLLFLVIVLDISLGTRRWWSETSVLEKGLVAGIFVHMGYFLFLVTQIMPYAQRFYYPTLPAIIYLAANAMIRLLSRLPGDWMVKASSASRPYRIAAIAAAVLVLPPHVGELDIFSKFAHHNFADFNLLDEYKLYFKSYWFGLDHFSTLPSDAMIATTEVGHVGALNLDKIVVDIAGLNDPLFVHHRFSADEFFLHYRPDLIYMPHPGYRAMNEALEQSLIFKSEYDFIPADKLGIQTMGIALKRDSKYYREMREVVNQTCNERAAGECTI